LNRTLDRRARQRLDELARQQQLRSLRVQQRRGGPVNFSANDYLGLSRHPLLIERACDWAREWGAGATASRLVCGTLPLHQRIEAQLAAAKGSEAALLFNAGFQANAGVLATLLQPELLGAHQPLVFADKLIHASMYQGLAAAGVAPIRFQHNDCAHLRRLLEKRADEPGQRFILVESVYSMDGDIAPLAGLRALAAEFDCFLYADEAHATGVLGDGGWGLCKGGDTDLLMGTFSKALGGFGAYVCCSAALRDYLVNRCAAFIYATALPPAVLGAMDAALELVPQLDAERARLRRHGQRLRHRCTELGLDTAGSETQIVPILLGDAGRTLAAAQTLLDRGLLGIAIRPPTVPPKSARIRLALSAAHSAGELDRLCDALAEIA